jgi:predicted amidohydrolase
MGVKILFIPAAFSTSTGPAHWEMLVRMRAMELQGYVIGVQPAFNEGLSYIPYGHSVAAGPFGEIISQASGEESIKLVEIDIDECDKLKRRFPLLKHRRQDLYRTVWLNADRD